MAGEQMLRKRNEYMLCYFYSDSQRQRSKKGKETKELSDMVKFSKV